MTEQEESAKYPPQKYTQKLINAGVIEFQENDIDEETDDYRWVVYSVTPDFTVLYFNDCMEVPALVGNIVERYHKDLDDVVSFDCFEIYPYEDMDVDDVLNPEEEITIYKRMEI